MTNTDFSKIVGRNARIKVGNMLVNVRVVDARSAYGRDDVLITPVNGEGRQWVRLTSIELMEGL
jgi:hypothetical protein